MNNLGIYDKVRTVPESAKKQIKGGRLSGMTDINPMWRIKTLTETFGPCGFGWWYEITRQWLETGAGGEITANVNILLHYTLDGKTSQGIPGTGGSKLVANEKSGPYTDDECYKKALTDAISVACKALGVGADIYWDKDSTKYDTPETPAPPPRDTITKEQASRLIDMATVKWGNEAATKFTMMTRGKKTKDLTQAEYEDLCGRLMEGT